MMKRESLFFLLVCLLTAWTAGCGFAPAAATPTATAPAPTPTQASTSTPAPRLQEGRIDFTMDDGREFSGTVHGQGETAIILANMAQGIEAQWAPFVKAVDPEKFTVITFNYNVRSALDYSSAENEARTV